MGVPLGVTTLTIVLISTLELFRSNKSTQGVFLNGMFSVFGVGLTTLL